MKIEPPKRADRFLEWYCAEHFLEEVQGDLHEWFLEKVEEVGPQKARWYYYLEVIRYMRPFRFKSCFHSVVALNTRFMKNTLKITFRAMKKDFLSSFLKIGNIILGVMVFLLTFIYARYEMNYDQQHTQKDRIYRIGQQLEGNPWAATPRGVGPFIQDNFTEVENTTRFFRINNTTIEKDNQVYYEQEGLFADSLFFDVFTFEPLYGTIADALNSADGMVLTESMSRKYFDDQNPIGEILKMGENDQRTVRAVIRDVPKQSHFTFDFLCSMYSFDEAYHNRWSNWAAYTYVVLREGADQQAFLSALTQEYEKRYNAVGQNVIKAIMVPLNKIHLYTNYEKELASNGNISYIIILSSIGLFVLLIACINYTNLSLIKGFDRAKEVGLRKTVGASPAHLIFQFLGENFILLFISAVISVLLLSLATPYFRSFSGLDLPLSIFKDISIIWPVIITLLGLEIICGVYPAWALSRFRPSQILKVGGQSPIQVGKIGIIRKGLIILQFAVSILLAVGSIVIYQQLQHLQSKDIGFAKQEILLIKVDGQLSNSFDLLKEELEKVPGIKQVSASSSVPGYRIMVEGVHHIASENPEPVSTRILMTDADFVDTYDLSLKAGRKFKSGEFEEIEYMINAPAATAIFGEQDPLGQQIRWGRDTGAVVAILNDFNFESLHSEIDPLVITSRARASYASVRYDLAAYQEVIKGIQTVGQKISPNLPLIESESLTNRFAFLYLADNRLKTITLLFCFISILLTLSGIFGMSFYIAKQKIREIAIRKVLGSTRVNLVSLLSKNFFILTSLGLIIGIPAAYILSKWWLQDFAYQISISPYIFILASLFILGLVGLSSGYVTLRASAKNPAEVLKGE